MSLADAIRVLNQKVPPVQLPENSREPLQPSNYAGFSEVPQVPPEKTKIESVRAEMLDAGQAGHDIEQANEDRITGHVSLSPLLVECWTPFGIRRLVEADSVEHANWIRQMNPKPKQVRCVDCRHASLNGGVAKCGVGVDSGLATGGFWYTDVHFCIEFVEVSHHC